MYCQDCGEEIAEGATVCRHCGWSEAPRDTSGERETLFETRNAVLAGRFRLVRRLGGGGMGDVWLAHDQKLDETVALKVLRPELLGDQRAIADMKREVSLARKLNHPNVCGVYELHEDVDTHFIAMEYVEGQSLAGALAGHGGPLPLERVLPWAGQLAAALDYAHGQGVLHRDVKPGNVLLARDGTVKLADFGIARAAHEARTRTSGQRSSGTLCYMSPQQLLDERATRDDPRNDVYSFAATLYELLSGEPPFKGADVSRQIELQAPAPIEGVSPHVNEALQAGLAKGIEDRPPNCAYLVKALEGAPLEGANRGAAPQPRERKPGGAPGPSVVKAAIVICVLVAVFALAILVLSDRRRKDDPSGEVTKNQTVTPVDPTPAPPQPVPPEPVPPEPEPKSDVAFENGRLKVTAQAVYKPGEVESPQTAEQRAHDKAWQEAQALAGQWIQSRLGFEEQKELGYIAAAWAEVKLQLIEKRPETLAGAVRLATVKAELDVTEFDDYVAAKGRSRLTPEQEATELEIKWGLYDQQNRRIKEGSVVRTGDKFRIHFVATRTCYVSVINIGPTGDVTRLFPRTDVETNPQVPANTWVELPNSEDLYHFMDPKGQEEVIVVASLAPLDDIDTILEKFRNERATEADRMLLHRSIQTRNIDVAPRVEAAEGPGGPAEIEILRGKGSTGFMVRFRHQ